MSVHDKKKLKILVLAHVRLSKYHAGGLRIFELYSEIKRIRPDIEITLIVGEDDDGDCGLAVNQLFSDVKTIPTAEMYSRVMLEVTENHFDLIDFQYHQMGRLIAEVRKITPSSVLMFSPMESQVRGLNIYIGLLSRGESLSIRRLLGQIKLFFEEIYFCYLADRVTTVSSADYNALKLVNSAKKLFCVPTGVDGNTTKSYQADSSLEIVFFAYFGSRTNVEALEWYIENVHDRITTQVGGYQLRICGRGAEELVRRLASQRNNIVYVGEIDDITDALGGAAVGIAPALTGAGVRGKVHQYALHGVPCIASPIAVDGLLYENGISILIARDDIEFADFCIQLLINPEERQKIADAAKAICIKHYVWAALEPQIRSAYKI